MPRRPTRPTYEELLARVTALEAEIARLRAELAAARGGGEPPAVGSDAALAAPAPPRATKGRPAGIKANVVRLARHRPRRPRSPAAGARCRTGSSSTPRRSAAGAGRRSGAVAWSGGAR